ncbi:ABC transporter permease (plasmid) [Cetobacterium somerae]|uniref:ABC transporter permease n=1 Tax=Cetobacterium somerae TaxID=188913 RepID=UPI002E7C1381|nr:ABC transporter permease [Cetobacterium somerae]WVJ03223.1 ABC transporter permease [Cetobacterium somerae]
MNFLESLKGAIQNLKGNKVRSFLTMLGIIIGISSVITMSAIGKGGQQNITGDLKEGGYGKFTISIDKDDEEFRWKYLLEPEIVDSLKETNIFKNVSANVSTRVFLELAKRREIIQLIATTPDYEKIDKAEYIFGRKFLPFEYEKGEKILVIDNLTAKDLFGSADKAIGNEMSFAVGRKNSPISYKIVGVFKNPLEELIKVMGGRRIPRFMRTPLNTYDKVYDLSKGGYNSIIVESKNPENLAADMKNANIILEDITGVKGLYQVETMSNAAASFDNILSTLNLFITFVAGISLFVGGIGVMNIMLVSVIERTKEIGIRKAIGATNKNILIQFLMESVILTGIGGIAGVLIGITLALVIGYFVNIPPVFSVFSITLALGISTFIGVVFGVTPAKKASQLNPIDALRAE